MDDATLVINAGSSSIKFAIFLEDSDRPGLRRIYGGQVDGIGGRTRLQIRGAPPEDARVDEAVNAGSHEQALRILLDWVDRHAGELRFTAAGHRVLHGGTRFAEPVVVDEPVLAVLESLVPLGPLHQPHNLDPIRALQRIRPGLTQVACFDTAFHRSMPAVAQLFALPVDLAGDCVRRYGFHGLSYEYIAGVLPEHLGAAAEGRVIVAHLGNGASMCAMAGRRSVETTMSFTPLDGLPMGTRSGAVDPGAILYLLKERGMDVGVLSDLLRHRSGLLGISGISGDMRELLAASSPRAAQAVDYFVYHAGRALGSLAAALGGLDAVVFTAGIGEHAAPIRARICAMGQWLGIRLDEDANARHGPCITSPASAVSAWVIPTDEELVIARHTRALAAGLVR